MSRWRMPVPVPAFDEIGPAWVPDWVLEMPPPKGQRPADATPPYDHGMFDDADDADADDADASRATR